MATELRALDDAADTPRIPRAILEDRYDGLLKLSRPRGRDILGDTSPRLRRLDSIVADLIHGVIRERPEDDNAVGLLIDEVQSGIRETIIRRVDELGLAR